LLERRLGRLDGNRHHQIVILHPSFLSFTYPVKRSSGARSLPSHYTASIRARIEALLYQYHRRPTACAHSCATILTAVACAAD
jgi:hypothetical protein